MKDWKIAVLDKKQKITAFADQSDCPNQYAAIIAGTAFGSCCAAYHTGAYNFSARDQTSYLDLAKLLCAEFKLDAGLIEKKSARADNPFYLNQDVLDCSAAENTVGYVPPFSGDIVQAYFRTMT